MVNFEDSFTEVPRLEQPMPGSHSASQHVLTRSGSMPSASLSQPNLTTSSSHRTDKKDCPGHRSRPKMEGVLSPDNFQLMYHSACHWWLSRKDL